MTAPVGAFEEVWRASVIDDADLLAEHGDVIEVMGQPGVSVVDRLAHQRRELSLLLPPVGQELLDEAPRWIYYPWRRTVTRTLGPLGFRRLRFDRNRNRITEAEQAALLHKTISVVGLSVGHAIAFTLAQEGLCGHVQLADFDALDLSNLNRLPSTVLDVGVNKTTLLGRRIAELDPYLDVTIFPEGATTENLRALVENADLVIDECDSIDIKFRLRFVAKEAGVPVVMHTSDGGILDVERFDLERARPVFHGMVDVDDVSQLEGLSNADKIPLIMAILDVQNVSARMGASLLEMDDQLTTWPQLASDVMLGAGMVGAAVRRWGLGQALPSGRLRIDLDADLERVETPEPVAESLFIEPTEPPPGDNLADKLIDSARHAPSGGNSQPWRFAVDDASFSVFVDPGRTSGIDIAQRGSLVAAGAALCNAEVTAAAHARLGPVRILSGTASQAQLEGNQPVATMRLGDQVDPALADLEGEVLKRTSVRTPGQSAPIDRGWLSQATRQAAAEHTRLVVLQGSDKSEAGRLWAEADRIRFLDPLLHDEMMSELRWQGDDLTTGIDVRSLALGDSDLSILRLARRPDVIRELGSWSGGARLGDGSRELIDDADALIVLTAPGPLDADFVSGGRTLQRIWLGATAAGVGLHPLSPLFLYALNRNDLRSIVSHDDAARLWDLRTRFGRLCGLSSDEPLTLCLRATSAPPVTIRSFREPLSARRM